MAGSKTRRSPARATPQRGRRGLRGRQPLARWGLFLAAFGLLHAAIVIGGPGLAELATAATARASGWILGWLGLGGEVVGSRVFSKAFPVDIIFECTAVYPMAMFTAAVLAFPAGWRAQALGLLLGLPALAAINLVRVVSLVWLGHVHPAWFGAAHLLVWQSLIIVCTVLVWIAWVDTLARSEEALGA